MSAVNLAHEISSHLLSKGLSPTTTWIANFLSTQRSSVPLPALKQTSLFRILSSDLSTSLQRSQTTSFPADIHNGQVRDRRLAGPIPVQVLGVEDIGRSRWSQVEALEAEERGETTKGREIIRVVPGEESEAEPQRSMGPHKLILQDVQGKCAYAVELLGIEGIGLNMNIGTKLLLKDVTVARGLLLLDPKCVIVLGGKIDELHKKWKEGRKEALKVAAQGMNTEAE